MASRPTDCRTACSSPRTAPPAPSKRAAPMDRVTHSGGSPKTRAASPWEPAPPLPPPASDSKDAPAPPPTAAPSPATAAALADYTPPVRCGDPTVDRWLVALLRGADDRFGGPLLTWSATRPTVARTRASILAADGEERAPTSPKTIIRPPRAGSHLLVGALRNGRESVDGRCPHNRGEEVGGNGSAQLKGRKGMQNRMEGDSGSEGRSRRRGA